MSDEITITSDQLSSLHRRYCRLAFDLAIGQLQQMREACANSVSFTHHEAEFFDFVVKEFLRCAEECCKAPAHALWQADLAEMLDTLRAGRALQIEENRAKAKTAIDRRQQGAEPKLFD